MQLSLVVRLAGSTLPVDDHQMEVRVDMSLLDCHISNTAATCTALGICVFIYFFIFILNLYLNFFNHSHFLCPEDQ